MTQFAAVGADLFLAGHLHVSHIGHTAARYRIAGHSALVVQAGTISARLRGEPNSFNVLRVDRPHIAIARSQLAVHIHAIVALRFEQHDSILLRLDREQCIAATERGVIQPAIIACGCCGPCVR